MAKATRLGAGGGRAPGVGATQVGRVNSLSSTVNRSGAGAVRGVGAGAKTISVFSQGEVKQSTHTVSGPRRVKTTPALPASKLTSAHSGKPPAARKTGSHTPKPHRITPDHRQRVERQAERAVKGSLHRLGYEKVFPLQYNLKHGVDMGAFKLDGKGGIAKAVILEVKGRTGREAGISSFKKQVSVPYVRNRLERAAQQGVTPEIRRNASTLLNLMRHNGSKVERIGATYNTNDKKGPRFYRVSANNQIQKRPFQVSATGKVNVLPRR